MEPASWTTCEFENSEMPSIFSECKIYFRNAKYIFGMPNIFLECHLLDANSICLQELRSYHKCLVPQQIETRGRKIGEKLLSHLVIKSSR